MMAAFCRPPKINTAQRAALVESLPTGETDKEKDISNWLYVDGQYKYDPLPDPPEPEPVETTDDVLNALLGIEQTDGGETNE